MNRLRITVTTAALTVAALSVVPSQAAPTPKPKPIKMSYTVTLPPDPSKEATSTAGMAGCSGLSPASVNHKPFTLPAAGTLTVKLDGEDPAKGALPAGLDWDLYLTSAAGVESESDGATGHEQAVMTVKKKTSVTIDVCNLDGTPHAAVSLVFTYT